MDIPDFEELEWLESHTLEDQFDGDFELQIELPSPPSSPEPDKPPKRPTLSLPPKPSPFKPQPQINPTAKKRVRSDIPKSISLDVDNDYESGSDGKRIRTGEEEARNEKRADVVPMENDERSEGVNAPEVVLNGNVGSVEKDGETDDDDWLRYSPPKDNVEEKEAVEGEKEERILSKYATEIEGDCVPVTGLDGERVYAKICRYEMNEEARRKKLSVRGDFNGEGIGFDVSFCLNFLTCDVFLLGIMLPSGSILFLLLTLR